MPLTVTTAGNWRTRRWTTSCTAMPCSLIAAEDPGGDVSPCRLCQFATDTDGAFLPGFGRDCRPAEPIPDGAEVVVALDGTFSDDTTAPPVGTVSAEPHFDTVKVWQRHNGDDSYRVPVAEVEQTYGTLPTLASPEIVADPFRWTRTMQALESEQRPVVEFPHSPARLTAATGDLYSAAINGRLTIPVTADSPSTSPPRSSPKTPRHPFGESIPVPSCSKIPLRRLLGHGPFPRHLACNPQKTKESSESSNELTYFKPFCSGSTSLPLSTPTSSGTTRAPNRRRTCHQKLRKRWEPGSGAHGIQPSSASGNQSDERLRVTGFNRSQTSGTTG